MTKAHVMMLVAAFTMRASLPVARLGPLAPPRAAAIRGVITVKPQPQRRVANRYAGTPTPAAQQEIPVIVYLRGASLPAPRTQAKPSVMMQRDTSFAPSYIVLGRGSSVNFQNQDPFCHNVFSYSRTKRFDLGRFPRPEMKNIVFDKTGTVDIFCEIHKSMRAVVLVTDSDLHDTVGAGGAYEIADVPPGTYDLVVWHPDRGEKVVRVTVPASGVLTVNSAI